MRTTDSPRWPAVAGPLLAAAAVALSAYASHGAEGPARAGLLIAAAFAFGHGLALATLGAAVRGRCAMAAFGLLLLGTVLFSGSLVARHLFGLPSAAAPFGGVLLIVAWLLLAVAARGR